MEREDEAIGVVLIIVFWYFKVETTSFAVRCHIMRSVGTISQLWGASTAG